MVFSFKRFLNIIFFLVKLLFSLNRPTHWADSVSKLQCPSVCLSVYVSVPLFAFLKRLITPIYKGCKSNQSISKRFLRAKLRKDIGLHFCDFGIEMIENRRAEKIFCWSLPFTVD